MNKRTSTRALTRSVAAFAAIALVGAACGSDDSDDSSSDTTADTAAESTEAAGGDDSADSGGDCEVVKAAFVYVGPIGNTGWTKKHDDGRLPLEENLGDCVETSFLESVPEGAESEAVFERLARDGNDIIFGTSFGYMDQMLAMSEEYPDVVFEHGTGFKVSDNMGTYFGAAEEARYLSGMAAGAASESGQLGYVAAFPIPEVIRGINAFTLGAQAVNPDATVEVVWTSTWFDPVIEKEAAESLLNGGADVIAQHQDTPSAGEAAEEAGAFWVGYNDDMSRFAPEAWLTAPVWDWGPFYTAAVQAVADGTWTSDQFYGNMADGTVQLAEVSETVPEETRTAIDGVTASIIDGSFAPFTGPILDQDGNEVVAAGVVVDLGSLLGMDYFVAGVIGSATG
ncbi:MAG: BMP family ABC transporter substrate-binding protein [Acidimicrobiia bacterium]|nr:BMP family ABC transporter substrate-binding protein [Acidimicrobiia bacterium]